MSNPDRDDQLEDFASMLADFEKGGAAGKKRRDPQVGEEVRGRIISIGRESVFLDLGTKSDGVIALAELCDAEGRLNVAVGDEIEARVAEVGGGDGLILLRRVGKGVHSSAELEQAYAAGIPVEGLVTGMAGGGNPAKKAAGLEVQVAGVRGFCPASQVDLRHIEDLSSFVGQRLTFRIQRLESSSRGLDLVLSRRALLEEEAAEQAAATRKQLLAGATLRGKVIGLKEFGAFVDLAGGSRGLST